MFKQARSRDGCGACRQKVRKPTPPSDLILCKDKLTLAPFQRIKCDETRPRCRNCQGRNIQCPGFARQLRWKTTSLTSGAVRKHPRKTLAMQQATAQSLSPDPSTSQLIVIGQNWRQQPTMQGSQTNAHDSSFIHDHVSLPSPPLASASRSQTSTLDPHPAGAKESEQQHEVNFTSATSVLDTAVSQPVTPQSSTECGDSLNQTEITSPVGVLAHESSSPHTAESTEYVLSQDTPPCVSASSEKTRDSGGDQHHNLMLGDIDPVLELTSSDAWLCSIEQQSGDDSDFDISAVTAQVGQQCVDSDSLVSASASWQRNIWIDAETENNLTVHYFENICQMMSCFDSRQNPFRKDIPRVMLTCEYLNDCIKALSAAHLANSICGMDNIAVRHQTKAMRGLMSVLQKLQSPSRHGSSDNELSRLSVTFTRYQALLAALLLAISAAWVDASTIGLAHYHGAKLLFQAWLSDEGIHDTLKESVILDREQSFIEVLAMKMEKGVLDDVNVPLQAGGNGINTNDLYQGYIGATWIEIA
ncbi:uncharacterized protein yc1106_07646 [Curvularia clavata]|uniref:Zn(2)-C6 fungal-type domain-containing protein n=1 Tax=Curvularia clavata TaxID=95742 RepID=A0A9Q8ZE78_CURCL|nr:uncharacterized protein yc1106_07646 [Curvularia clavata]